MSNLFGALLVLGVCLLVATGIFVVFRAMVLWYWRIDEILLTLQKIEGHLRGLSTKALVAPPAEPQDGRPG